MDVYSQALCVEAQVAMYQGVAAVAVACDQEVGLMEFGEESYQGGSNECDGWRSACW